MAIIIYLDRLKGLVFIDLFGFGAGLVGSLGFALNITLGLTQTCNALGQDYPETERYHKLTRAIAA